MDDPISPGLDTLDTQGSDADPEEDGGPSSLLEFTEVSILEGDFLLSNIKLIIHNVITVSTIIPALPARLVTEEAIFVPAYVAVPVVKTSVVVLITEVVIELNFTSCFKPLFVILFKEFEIEEISSFVFF